jgi:hypothetical protein
MPSSGVEVGTVSTITLDDGIKFAEIYIESVNCVFCYTKPCESSIAVIMMYDIEFRPKSYEFDILDSIIQYEEYK